MKASRWRQRRQAPCLSFDVNLTMKLLPLSVLVLLPLGLMHAFPGVFLPLPVIISNLAFLHPVGFSADARSFP
jgi:hypothetical protein